MRPGCPCNDCEEQRAKAVMICMAIGAFVGIAIYKFIEFMGRWSN